MNFAFHQFFGFPALYDIMLEMFEGEKRIYAILDILAENPSITPDELDEQVDKISKDRRNEGKVLPRPSEKFVQESKGRIFQALEKKYS